MKLVKRYSYHNSKKLISSYESLPELEEETAIALANAFVQECKQFVDKPQFFMSLELGR